MHHTHTRTYTQMEKETREKENGSLTTRAPRELSLLLRGGLRHSVQKAEAAGGCAGCFSKTSSEVAGSWAGVFEFSCSYFLMSCSVGSKAKPTSGAAHEELWLSTLRAHYSFSLVTSGQDSVTQLLSTTLPSSFLKTYIDSMRLPFPGVSSLRLLWSQTDG